MFSFFLFFLPARLISVKCRIQRLCNARSSRPGHPISLPPPPPLLLTPLTPPAWSAHFLRHCVAWSSSSSCLPHSPPPLFFASLPPNHRSSQAERGRPNKGNVGGATGAKRREGGEEERERGRRGRPKFDSPFPLLFSLLAVFPKGPGGGKERRGEVFFELLGAVRRRLPGLLIFFFCSHRPTHLKEGARLLPSLPRVSALRPPPSSSSLFSARDVFLSSSPFPAPFLLRAARRRCRRRRPRRRPRRRRRRNQST